SSAWVSVPKISRSIESFAANVPKRLVMCTADSNGSRGAAGGGASMRRTIWRDRGVRGGRFCRRHGVATDQELRGDSSRDGGRRLVVNLGEADGADQAANVVVG